MLVLKSVDELLNHIKEVQEDVKELSSESLIKMSSYMEKNNLEIDEDISTALQYQDIITQQLNASIEAIESVMVSIERFAHAYKNDEDVVEENMLQLQEKLNAILQEAKDKKNRFSGRVASQSADDEIEFF